LGVEKFMTKNKFLNLVEKILNVVHDKQKVINIIQTVKANVDHYIWKEMRPNHVTMVLNDIFLRARKFLFAMDLNGMVKSIENIHKYIDHAIWKTMDAQWPEMEQFIQNILRKTLGSEELWKKLDAMYIENGEALKQFQLVADSIMQFLLQPSTFVVENLLGILTSYGKLRNALNQIQLNADMLSFFYPKTLHCDSCIRFENGFWKTKLWRGYFQFMHDFVWTNWPEDEKEQFSDSLKYLFDQAREFIVYLFGGYDYAMRDYGCEICYQPPKFVNFVE